MTQAVAGVVALSHAGALSSYRSLMLIDLESAAFMVALWTLAGAGEEDDDIELAEELKTTWLAVMSSPAELRDAP